MKKYIILSMITLLVVINVKAQQLDKQAHRGGRGLMPENTIIAMKNAMDLKTTLEMDLYLTKDNQVILSHDDHFLTTIALDENGKELTKEDEKKYILTKMNYEDIKKFDVGLKPNPAFPQKKNVAAKIPLFTALIDSVENYAKKKKYPSPLYDVEAKSTRTTMLDPTYQEKFIKGMVAILKEKKIEKRTTIQSFDPVMLEIVKRDYPKLKTAFLVSKGSLTDNLKKLTFKPTAYSAIYTIINQELVDECHKLGIQIIAWTPNTKEEIENLKKLGVDAIITDYPNLYE